SPEPRIRYHSPLLTRLRGGTTMIPHHVYDQLALLGLLWLCLMLHSIWPSRRAVSPQRAPAPRPPRFIRKRTPAPKPSPALSHRPHSAACAPDDAPPPQAPPPICPEAMPPSPRRPCVIDTARPCCPPAGCAYRGGLGLGNLRANGPPRGG